MREKEHLDIADTNTLLLHPSQFSITNQSSPGGGGVGAAAAAGGTGQSGRTTRHARHRIDMEEANSGVSFDGSNKRKRKFMDDECGSPVRDGMVTPAERARAKAQGHQNAPLYSIHSLFTEKELNLQSHQAHIATRHFFSRARSSGQVNGTELRAGKDQELGNSLGWADDSNLEDDDMSHNTTNNNNVNTAAPEMERSISQTVHPTRSTRNAAGGHHQTRLDILSDVAMGNRPQLPYATLHNYQPRNGASLPAVSQLIQEEIDEDQEKLKALVDQPFLLQGPVERAGKRY